MMNSKIICVDASFIIRLLNSHSNNSPFIITWQEWQDQQYLIVAPSLFYYEIANAFHRYVLAKQLDLETATENLKEALNLKIRIYGDYSLHEKALNLANVLRLPATYDAHYLALSEHLNADLAKAGVYNKNVQKQITALAGIRNSAAHGKPEEFTEQDVSNMIKSVNTFLAEHLSS